MYRLAFLKGHIKGYSGDIYRVIVMTEENGYMLTEMGFEPINEGFGVTEKDAMLDFIKKNKYNVLRKLFLEGKDAIQNNKEK